MFLAADIDAMLDVANDLFGGTGAPVGQKRREMNADIATAPGNKSEFVVALVRWDGTMLPAATPRRSVQTTAILRDWIDLSVRDEDDTTVGACRICVVRMRSPWKTCAQACRPG